MGLLTHPKRKKLNGKNENEHSVLAGHADPIYKSQRIQNPWKILGTFEGTHRLKHLLLHKVAD
jgi:hypothetical protein